MSPLSIVAWALALLPEPVAVALAKLGAWSLWNVFGVRRRHVQESLRMAFPELSTEQLEQRGYAVMVHVCRVAIETLRIRTMRGNGFSNVRVEGLDHLVRALEGGQGFLALSAHLGSWEVAVAGAAHLHQLPLSLAVKELGTGTEAFITREREASGLQCIKRQGMLRNTIRALASNRGVAFVLDQNATRSIGTFVDFFGRPACTMTVLAVLARRTGVPVIPTFATRTPDGQHVLEVGPPIAWEDKGGLQESLHHMTQRYTQIIEEAVRRHPEQWLWTHRRWRTQPLSTPVSEAADV